MSTSSTLDAHVIADLARAAAMPTPIMDVGNGAFAYPITGTGGVDVIDVERYLTRPRRARGEVRPASLDAFIEYTERHGGRGTTIWVDTDEHTIVAVLNDHEDPDTPGHGDHRAVLSLTMSPEWKHWVDKNGAQFDQSTFAEHMEDGVAEIVEPAAADMLELASSFHARSSSVFRSAKRLDNGEVQMQYDEEVTASAGKSGDMRVPSEFVLAVAPFIGSQLYRLTARLRYRVNSGKLSLSYKLDRPHLVIRHAMSDVADTLTEKFPSIVFIGRPRQAQQ